MNAANNRGWVALATLVVLGIGCPSTTDPYPPAAVRAGASTGRAGAGSSTTGGAGVATSTATGAGATSGTSGGSTGSTGMACPDPTQTPALDDCGDAGLIEIRSNLVNGLPGQTIGEEMAITGSVQFQDLDDPGAAVNSRMCGELIYCVPLGHVLSMAASVSGYEPIIVEDLLVTAPTYFQEIDMLPQTAAGLLSGLLPGYMPTEPTVFVKVRTGSQSPCPWNGWSFTLFEADGGPQIDAGLAYFSGAGFGSAPETGGEGAALFYNVVSRTGEILVTGTLDPLVAEDAGVDAGYCSFDFSVPGFLQTAHVDPSYPMVFFLFQLP